MAIIPSQKNPLLILKGFRDTISQRTNITNFDRDSKIRSVIDVVTEEALSYREEVLASFYANQLSNATGKALVAIGDGMGLPKREAEFASSDSTEQNMAFYVDSGTFGDINGAANIPLPAGTVVFSRPSENELGARIEFLTVNQVTLLAASDVGFVAVKARIIGSGHNVGASVIRGHGFTSYVDSANATLKVINFYPILTGRNREGDTSYRFRLASLYTSLLGLNETRYKLEALEVPGVVETRVLPGFYGIGTSGVITLGAENQTTSNIIRGVQAKLTANLAPGLSAIATTAVQTTFDFELKIDVVKTLSTSAQLNIRNQIKTEMRNYLRRVGIGGIVEFDTLADTILKKVRRVTSLDSSASDDVFDKVYVTKGYANGVIDDRRKIIGNTYTLLPFGFASLGTLTATFV